MEHLRYKYSKAINKLEFWIDSNFIKDDIEFINNNNINSIVVNRFSGFELTNLNFLKDINHIVNLTIVSDLIIDFTGINYLKKIETLYISEIGKNITLDFMENSKLYALNIPTSNFINAENISILTIGKSNIKNIKFELMQKLEEIDLIQCTGFTSLNFLPKNLKLKSIGLSYISKLTSIEGVDSFEESLEKLTITKCPKIENLDLISNLLKLKKIIIDSSGNFSNPILFENFKYLNHFVVTGKSKFIVDNVSILENKNIEHLYIKA